MAYLDSAFETGLRSPLDEAILAHGRLEQNVREKIDEVPFEELEEVSVLVDEGRAHAGGEGRSQGHPRAVDALRRPAGGVRAWDAAARAEAGRQLEAEGAAGARHAHPKCVRRVMRTPR